MMGQLTLKYQNFADSFQIIFFLVKLHFSRKLCNYYWCFGISCVKFWQEEGWMGLILRVIWRELKKLLVNEWTGRGSGSCSLKTLNKKCIKVIIGSQSTFDPSLVYLSVLFINILNPIHFIFF